MDKILQMEFKSVAGKSRTLTLNNPRANLDRETVETAMDQLIAADAFEKDADGLYAVKQAARYVETITTPVFDIDEA